MNLINQFGRMVSSESLKDPEKARRLLLMGYRLQEKRLKFFPDKNLPDSAHYVARIVMKNIIHALARPENAAMVSIFVPGELLTAAGLTPYSVPVQSVSRHFSERQKKRDSRKRCVPIIGYF